MDWRDRTERLERIEDLLDELREAAREGAVQVVEGRRDEEALRSLGVDGDYARVSESGVSLPSAAEEIYSRSGEAVLMLDWDPHGRRLERRLSELLERFGVETDRDVRRRLGVLVRKDVTDVESLPSLIRRLRGEENVYGF